jgi:hypothetical protein
MFERLPIDLIRHAGIPFWQIATLNKQCYYKFKDALATERISSKVACWDLLVPGYKTEYIKFMASYKNLEIKTENLWHDLSLCSIILHSVLSVRPDLKIAGYVLEKLDCYACYGIYYLDLFCIATKLSSEKNLYLDNIQNTIYKYEANEAMIIYEIARKTSNYFRENTTSKSMINGFLNKRYYVLVEHILKCNDINWQPNCADFISESRFLQLLHESKYDIVERISILLIKNKTFDIPAKAVEFLTYRNYNSNIVVAICQSGKLKLNARLFKESIQNGHSYVIEAMIDNKNELSKTEILTLLLHAIYYQKLDIVKMLVERCGAPVTQRGRYSPLAFARKHHNVNGRDEIVDYLSGVYALRRKIGFKNVNVGLKTKEMDNFKYN